MKKTILAAAVLTLAFLPNLSACKKAPDSQESQTAAVESLLESAPAPDNWKQDEINSLLAYIPENSPLVLTTTRQIAAEYPEIEKQLKKLREKSASVRELEKFKSALDPAVLRDSFGVDLKYTEAAAYITDQILVIKLRTADAQKFISAVDSMLTAALADGLPDSDIAKIKKAHTIGRHHGTIYRNPRPADGNGPQPAAADPVNLVYLEGEKHIVTAAVPMLMADKSADIFNDAYKLPQKPIQASSLGEIKKGELYRGYFVFEPFIDAVFSYDRMKKARRSPEMNDHIDSFIREWKWILGNTPKIEISGSISENGEHAVSSTIIVPDKNTRDAIKNVLGRMPEKSIIPGIASAGIHIKFETVFQHLFHFSEIIRQKLEKREVACTFMQRVYGTISSYLQNPEIMSLTSRRFVLFSLLSTLDSAGVSLIPGSTENEMPSVQWFTYLHKKDLAPKYTDFIITMLTDFTLSRYKLAETALPEGITPNTRLPIVPDVPYTVVFTPIGFGNLTIQHNQTDLWMTSSGYDIKSLTNPAPSAGDKFFTLKLTDPGRLPSSIGSFEFLSAFKEISLDAAPTDRGIAVNYRHRLDI